MADSPRVIQEGTWSRLSTAALRDLRLQPAEVRTLAALGVYTDDTGYCYPSMETIGTDIGRSRRQVHRDIRKLCKLGYLQKWRQTRINHDTGEKVISGGYAPNAYQLVYPPVPAKPRRADTKRVDSLGAPGSANEQKRPSEAPGSIENGVTSGVTAGPEDAIHKGSEQRTAVTTGAARCDKPPPDAVTLDGTLTNPTRTNLKADSDFFDSIVKEVTTARPSPHPSLCSPSSCTAALQAGALVAERRLLERRQTAQAAIWTNLPKDDFVRLMLLESYQADAIVAKAEAAEMEAKGTGREVVCRLLAEHDCNRQAANQRRAA